MNSNAVPNLATRIPSEVTGDTLLDAFLLFVQEQGLTPYPAQEEAVLEIMHKNVEQAQLVLKELIPMLGSIKPCSCREAAKFAVVTDPEKIPLTLKDELSILFG